MWLFEGLEGQTFVFGGKPIRNTCLTAHVGFVCIYAIDDLNFLSPKYWMRGQLIMYRYILKLLLLVLW